MLVVVEQGADDLHRVGTTTRVIAVDMPNTQAASALPWGSYRTTVDAVEDSTGFDFLRLLPPEVQEAVEGHVDTGPAEYLKNQVPQRRPCNSPVDMVARARSGALAEG